MRGLSIPRGMALLDLVSFLVPVSRVALWTRAGARICFTFCALYRYVYYKTTLLLNGKDPARDSSLMYLTRRKVIKSLAHLTIASSACQLLPTFVASSVQSNDPLYGINAYYLMIESYRKAKQNPKVDVRKTIIKYLQDDLALARLQDKSKVNAIRFWAFNNYPSPNKIVFKNQVHFDRSSGLQLINWINRC